MFGEEVMRREFLVRLNAIGFVLPEAALARRPSLKAAAWAGDGRVEASLGVTDWIVAQLGSMDDRGPQQNG